MLPKERRFTVSSVLLVSSPAIKSFHERSISNNSLESTSSIDSRFSQFSRRERGEKKETRIGYKLRMLSVASFIKSLSFVELQYREKEDELNVRKSR